jgi:hypothetical protein
MAYVPWWPLFALLNVGVGFAYPGVYVTAIILGGKFQKISGIAYFRNKVFFHSAAVELVGPKYRMFASTAVSFFFSLGQIVLGVSAWFIRDYQILQLVISVPILLFLPYWWLVENYCSSCAKF